MMVSTPSRVSPKAVIGRTAVIVGIMVLIALAHVFRLGTCLPGSLFTLCYSYFSDIVVPLGMYLLISLNDPHIPSAVERRRSTGNYGHGMIMV